MRSRRFSCSEIDRGIRRHRDIADHHRTIAVGHPDCFGIGQKQQLVMPRGIHCSVGGGNHGDRGILDPGAHPGRPFVRDVGQEHHDLAQQHGKRGHEPEASRQTLTWPDARRAGIRIVHGNKLGEAAAHGNRASRRTSALVRGANSRGTKKLPAARLPASARVG